MTTTFSSGLDDYPRAVVPSDDEDHLDLLCWIAHGASLMSRLALDLASQVTDSTARARFNADAARYSDLAGRLVESVTAVHWSEKHGAFMDLGWTLPMPDHRSSDGTRPSGRAHFVQDVMVSCG